MTMNYEVWQRRYPLPKDVYAHYVNTEFNPPVNLTEVDIQLAPDTQLKLKIPVAGSVALLLTYHSKAAALMSVFDSSVGLYLLQLQGINSRVGFRVSTGLYWVDLMADETVWFAHQPESGITRIVMPAPREIPGIASASSESVSDRYLLFADRAELRWSEREKLYVRDIHEPPG